MSPGCGVGESLEFYAIGLEFTRRFTGEQQQ